MRAPRLQKEVTSVLLEEARKGTTTKKGATAIVMRRLEAGGGPGKFGIGPAEMLVCLKEIVGKEVGRQLKSQLPEEFIAGYKWPNAPPSLLAELHRLPAWIAIEEGSDAHWVPSLKALVRHWETNAEIKMKKADQTVRQADVSTDIARYLIAYGFSSLDEAT